MVITSAKENILGGIKELGFQEAESTSYYNDFTIKSKEEGYSLRLTLFSDPFFSIQLISIENKIMAEATIIRQFRIENISELIFVLSRTGEFHLENKAVQVS